MSLLPSNDPNSHMIARRPLEDARQYAYRVIKSCVLELFLPPGQKMNEIDLTSSLDVSRTPMYDTFTKPSRENLVDTIPQGGAFISRVDSGRIEHAIWLHTKFGTSMLHTIFIRSAKKNDLESLYYNLCQLGDYLYQGNLNQAPRLLFDYYHQLYILAGDMDLVWESLQKVDMDLQWPLYPVISSPAVVEGFLCEFINLTDTLANRNNDQACLTYGHHMSRILLLFPFLKQHNPEYFICGSSDATS